MKIIEKNFIDFSGEKFPLYLSFFYEGTRYEGKLINENNSFYFLVNLPKIDGLKPKNQKLMGKYKYSWWAGKDINGSIELVLPYFFYDYMIVPYKKWSLSLVYRSRI